MNGEKVAVVTGGNKGIGYAIVKGMCEKFPGSVYLTARDVERGQTAISQLRSQGVNPLPLFHQLDITDPHSINELSTHLRKAHGGLDLLVNNAGISFYSDSPETFAEQTIGTMDVNYFGTLQVCEAMFPILRENAKVVNVSSRAGHLSRVPSPDLKIQFNSPFPTLPQLNDLMNQFVRDAMEDSANCKNKWGASSYAISKLGINVLTVIQQKLFDEESPNRNIRVNSIHPGYTETDMTSRLTLDRTGILTTEEGAKAPLFLALEADNLRGKYLWSDCKVVNWQDS